MRRTQDIVLARLRLLAARWRIPPAPTPGADGPSEPAPVVAADPGARGPADSGRPDRGHRPREGDAEPAEPALEPDPQQGPPGAPRTALLLPLLGLLVVGVVAIAGVMLVRAWPRPQAQVVAQPTASALVAPLEAFATTAPTPTAPVVVHVVGAVRRPGVVTLPAGARVADAVRAAGGMRKGGRLGATNLARPLVDGERVEIGGAADGGPAAGDAAAGALPGPAAPLDLNNATAAQLDLLPGVGPVTAAKILAWRSEHGRFSTVDELAEVPGIGPKTLEQLRPLVRT
jgi:competence protein ComEA